MLRAGHAHAPIDNGIMRGGDFDEKYSTRPETAVSAGFQRQALVSLRDRGDPCSIRFQAALGDGV